ncbi:MAG: hypothetical protein Q9208_003813 [Pyrenodesmia sp. 3 TL-2023]
MPTFLPFGVQALVLLILCNAVFSLPNQPRARRIELEGAQDVDKREICYDDDTLLSFKTYILDSAPYCSSLLGIEDFTSTVSQTSRTTTRELRTSFTDTVTTTATRASVTVFSTVYDTNLQKRNYPVPTSAPFYQDNPYAYSVIANDVKNASIAASYYSACSCLRLTPSTVGSVTVTSTVRLRGECLAETLPDMSQTRTISGVDYQQATDTVYVTTGTSTQILTRAGNPYTITVSSTVVVIPTEFPTLNTTMPIPLSTVYSSVGTSSPSGSIPSASFNVSFTLSTTSDGTRPTIAPTLNLTSLSVPNVTSVYINSTTSMPIVTAPSYPAGNLTSTYLSSSGLPPVSSGLPSPTGNLSTSRPISGLPTPSISMTSTFRPTSAAPFPSANLTVSSPPSSGSPTITLANLTITSLASSGFPTASANASSFVVVPSFPVSATITVTSFGPTVTSFGPTVTSPGETLSYPYPQNFTSVVTQPASTVTVSAISLPGSTETLSNPLPPSTISSPGTLIPAPSTAPILNINNCPGLNSTVVALSDGQKFAVVCETEFGGPTEIGLQEKTFQDCIENCGTANNGFSAVRCRGVTYYPDRLTGPNCFFKNAASLMAAVENDFAVSAVLVGYHALNATVSPSFMLPSATLARLPAMMPRV